MPNHPNPLETTCRLMGCEFNGTALFVWQAMEWLGRRSGPITSQESCGSWHLSAEDWTADGPLPDALNAAVHACDEARLRELAGRGT